MICKYKFKDFKCKETVDTDQEYCILHREFPEDPQSIEFSAVLSAKYDKVQEKISKRDYKFVGVSAGPNLTPRADPILTPLDD